MKPYTREEIQNIRREKIINFRESLGKSQKEFCAQIDMSASYYNRLENGGLTITEKTIQKIAMTFGVPMSTLMEDTTYNDVTSFSMEPPKNVYENIIYYQLNRLIQRGGNTNKLHMQGMLDLLMGVESALEERENFKDLCENEDKIEQIYMKHTFDGFMNIQ